MAGWEPMLEEVARERYPHLVARALLLTRSQADAEDMARRLAREEGIFCGISSGGACAVALRVARAQPRGVVVFIVCDRGDRYLSTGVFPA